ncbi:MAG: hypothetical protein KDE23_25835, partial [Caldilinea sp.]|nr:hypothetical protein [Caldilinea sp.]
ANALCNPVLPGLVFDPARLLRNASILAESLDLELPRVLAFTYAYACLNASWWSGLGDAAILQWSLDVAALVEPLLAPAAASSIHAPVNAPALQQD